jgi:hypothetical protein
MRPPPLLSASLLLMALGLPGSGQEPPVDVERPEPGQDLSAAAQVHVIAVYRGATPTAALEREAQGEVRVRVAASPEPIALVLTAFASTRWTLSCADGARVEAIFVAGRTLQTVEGAPPGASIVKLATPWAMDPLPPGDHASGADAHRRSLERLARLHEELERLLRRPPTTFQSCYEGGSFLVQHAGTPFPAQARVRALAGGRRHDRVVIDVAAAPEPWILVLTAYQAVHWELRLAEGAQVAGVLLGGYRGQEVSGLPASGVTVLQRSFFVSRLGGAAEAHLREQVRAIVGQEPATIDQVQGDSARVE